jgi:hypothetical protein
MSSAAHVWVLAPIGGAPAFDIARELFGWPEAIARVKMVDASIVGAGLGPRTPEDLRPPLSRVVVGPHWTVCAQLHAALGPNVPVGCATPIPDDFDGWLPRKDWMRSDVIVFVSDDRFDVDLDRLLPDRAVTRFERVRLASGRAQGRVFSIRVLVKRGLAAFPGAPPLG